MNRKSPKLRFDVATLMGLAGQKVYERGVAYDNEGRVEIITATAGRISARVKGTEPYRTELSGGGGDISGSCTCMAFRDFGFCKHMVATALHANRLGPDGMTEVESRREKFINQLKKQGVDALAAMLADWAERDEALMREIGFLAAMAEGDDETLFRHCKAAIDAAVHVHGNLEYDDAAGWADAVRTQIDQIRMLVEKGRAELSLRLLEHLFEELEEALQSIDDSNGEGGGAFAYACEVHLKACKAARPDPVGIARFLFGWETESDWDYFLDASSTYEEVLGEKGLAEYRRLANRAWQALAGKQPPASVDTDADPSRRFAVTRMMEAFALRDGDIDAVITIRAKDLSSAYRYLEIAKFCADHGRDKEALKWVSEGLWQFEDNPDPRLTRFAINLYQKTGQPEHAVKLGWQLFERRPDMDGYHLLKGLHSTGLDDAVRDRAIALLENMIAGPKHHSIWGAPADLLIAILGAEGLAADAWRLVREHGCSQSRLKALAEASEEIEPQEALAAYAKMIEELVDAGGKHNYEEAFAMTGRMKTIRARLGQDLAHAEFLAGLGARHKAKRNFMKLLHSLH
jgi:uncharacterized Zn finger protein